MLFHPSITFRSLKLCIEKLSRFFQFVLHLLQAYKLGMYGQKYVWFLASTSSHAWIFSPRSFERQRKNIECTLKQVVKAAEGFLIMTSVNIRQDNKTTVSGLVSQKGGDGFSFCP